MRGNPLWQLVLVTAAFVTLALPVWRLTRPAQATPVERQLGGKAAETAAAPVSPITTLTLETAFAPAPTEWTLSYLGQVVLQGKGQGGGPVPWKIALPKEGADLVLHATWPPAGEGTSMAAARVTARWPDGRAVAGSFWSPDGQTLDTVFTVAEGAAK